MTTVTKSAIIAQDREATAMLPYAGIALSGVLFMFGATLWACSVHQAGHVLVAIGAVVASFSGIDLVRRSRRHQ
jgi:hypothetical protein